MSWVAAAIAGSTIINGIVSSKAAGAQADAANNATGTQWNMYQQTRADNEPWRTAGANALGQMGGLMESGGGLNRRFSMSDFTSDPGYQFRLQQGQQALDRAAASKGMQLSGAQLKASQTYGQNMGNQYYQQSLGNWNDANNTQYNRLASMAGLGQTANQMNQAAGTNAANNVAQNQMGVGNAQAAGMVGMGNAVNNGVNQWANWNNSQNMWNALNGGSSTIGSGMGDPYRFGYQGLSENM